MKYAFMSSSAPDYTLDELIAAAKRYGYAGIEPRIEWKHGHGIEPTASADQRAKIKQTFADSGIAHCCLATGCRYSDPETRDEQITHTRTTIDLAADTGAPRLRVFGGQLAEGVDRERAIDLVADALKRVADHAAERGVSVCLETHDAWCDPDHVAAVMQRVDHEAIAINWDVLHTQRVANHSPARAWAKLKTWTRHTHVHDDLAKPDGLNSMPMGEGNVDHRAIIKLLNADGFDGFLSGEWINWQPPEVHLPREIERMQAYEAELA